MGFFSWIIVGIVAALIAKAIVPGRQGGGFFATLGLGVLGAIVGGFIGRLLGFNPNLSFFSFSTWIFGIGGSIIILVIWGVITKSRNRS